jgi:hypothetical protein
MGRLPPGQLVDHIARASNTIWMGEEQRSNRRHGRLQNFERLRLELP